MKNATFFALQGPEGTPADLASIVDAAEAHGGRLSVLHVSAVPIMTYAIAATPYGIPVIPEGWLGERDEMNKRLAVRQEEMRAYLTRESLTGEVATLCAEPTALHDIVAVRSLFADVSIALNSLRDDETAFNDIVYGLLFKAPGPLMLNVEKGSKALAPENVLLAWDNSLPAARAVRAALPLLKTAKEVTIATFDADPSRWGDGESPGADLAMWLSHHGCTVTVQEYVTGSKTVAEAILFRAQETTADLVVMGAYGRSRWNERFFGGTTETMIAQQDYAVLLSH
ncbi:universal stress protein family protein [Loktanella sp. PT4BL]|jgi:nucleotide-binding universal stress UspA family protein|uniref:universal stress protein n=1 Tax=Loktanella sp. PT4BL TaxID=2135611 RepID=UPI000D7739DB|nr:universal stress protein [Loktanella sp. PT4BL]PXW72075.1 universal stress protein family protein [Loktanella sp. PT4BL]